MTHLIIRHPTDDQSRGIVAGATETAATAIGLAIELKEKEPNSEFSVYALVGSVVPNAEPYVFEAI